MRWFDSHAHLDDARFDSDREQVLEAMFAGGIGRCALIGSDMESSGRAVKLAATDQRFVTAVGVHPHEAKRFTEADMQTLSDWILKGHAQVLGEIGLDFHYDYSPRPVQIQVFVAQLEWAMAHGVPVVLHIREAHEEVMAILRERRDRLPPFVVHCFSGSWEQAKQYLSWGAYVSLAGPVTFKNATKLKEVAKETPLDRLLIETDSPYLSPEPMRGKRNTPLNVIHVGNCIAQLRDMEPAALAESTYQNACAFYGIQE